MQGKSMTLGHWTNDQLLAEIYGAGPETDDCVRHLAQCDDCRLRLSRMQDHRRALEADRSWEAVDTAHLAEQRRDIYARLSQPQNWWHNRLVWRWASAATAAAALGAGLVVYQDSAHLSSSKDASISDAQLAQEVSVLAQDTEAQPAAPLKGLFE